MARTELNVIQFTKYNQAIYPHDYYIEVGSETQGKLTVVEDSAGSNQINYNDDALIGIDGLPLFSEFEAGHYVLKVEGFLKEPNAVTLQFEFKMEKPDDKYVLVVENTATVPTYHVETTSGDEDDDEALEVVENETTDEGKIKYDAVIKADGTRMYDSFVSDKFVKEVSGDKQITILKGNSIQGILDQTYDLRHGGTYYIRLESGRFKNTYGDDKGKVVLETTDTLVKAAVLCFK